MTTPTIVLVHFLFYRETYARKILGSLVRCLPASSSEMSTSDLIALWGGEFAAAALSLSHSHSPSLRFSLLSSPLLSSPLHSAPLFFFLLLLLLQFLVCLGVAQATQADVTTNSIGLFFAACGILVTSVYQIVRVGREMG